MRITLEETGMPYDMEVEMVHIAHEMDLFSSPYVFNTQEAVKMVKAGADMIVAHCGTTIGGDIGAKTVMTLDDACKYVQEIRDAAAAERSDIIVICHGGPISAPEDAEYIIQHCKGVHGFYGAASAERIQNSNLLNLNKF